MQVNQNQINYIIEGMKTVENPISLVEAIANPNRAEQDIARCTEIVPVIISCAADYHGHKAWTGEIPLNAAFEIGRYMTPRNYTAGRSNLYIHVPGGVFRQRYARSQGLDGWNWHIQYTPEFHQKLTDCPLTSQFDDAEINVGHETTE
jgi:hypothetical protein